MPLSDKFVLHVNDFSKEKSSERSTVSDEIAECEGANDIPVKVSREVLLWLPMFQILMLRVTKAKKGEYYITFYLPGGHE